MCNAMQGFCLMYYLYVQRFEISYCFCIQGMTDTEYDFKTKRPKNIRQQQRVC